MQFWCWSAFDRLASQAVNRKSGHRYRNGARRSGRESQLHERQGNLFRFQRAEREKICTWCSVRFRKSSVFPSLIKIGEYHPQVTKTPRFLILGKKSRKESAIPPRQCLVLGAESGLEMFFWCNSGAVLVLCPELVRRKKYFS